MLSWRGVSCCLYNGVLWVYKLFDDVVMLFMGWSELKVCCAGYSANARRNQSPPVCITHMLQVFAVKLLRTLQIVHDRRDQ